MNVADTKHEAEDQTLPPPAMATIVIAAYCAQNTITRAVQSACAQSATVEIVIVDDCSSDDTYKIACALGRDDPRIRVYRQAQNTGPAGARNFAIKESSAPWIAVLDADDFMVPDRIARMIKEAESNNLDFLADDIFRVTDADLKAKNNRLWSKTDFGQTDISFAQFVEGNRHNRLGQRGELGFVKPLIRRRFLEEAGLAYKPHLRLAEDFVLYAEALAAGCRFRLVDPRGYFAVFRSDSLSSRHSTSDLGAIVAADIALARNPALTGHDLAVLDQHRLDTHKEWAWRRMIDAVHQRDLGTIANLAVQPPAVVLSLVQKLLTQVWLRSFGRLLRRG
jgi:succinoglycan biosynthesis protein ExoU